MARSTGATLKDNREKWDRLRKQLAVVEIHGPNKVRVGVFGKQDSEVVIYAASNEFGTKTIPERSFLRAMVNEQQAFLKTFVAAEFAKVARLRQTTKEALRHIGEMGVGLVKLKIRKGRFTPLAPATIAAKGSDKPLIDTSRMIGAITWEEGKRGVKRK